MATFHGRGGMVYIGGSPAIVANARSWKFTIDKALDENNAFGDTWTTQLLGLYKWTGSIEGNFDSAETNGLFALATATTTTKLYLYPATSATIYYYGTIWPKLDLAVSLDAVVRYTMDFDGDGQLGSKP